MLEFVFSARGEWAEFKPRTRGGRMIHTSWVELRLSSGMILGIGILERERKAIEHSYLKKLFAPIPGADWGVRLVSVEPRGDELDLLLLANRKRIRVTVPAELVNLSAQYGSADLLLRMVQNKILLGGDGERWRGRVATPNGTPTQSKGAPTQK